MYEDECSNRLGQPLWDCPSHTIALERTENIHLFTFSINQCHCTCKPTQSHSSFLRRFWNNLIEWMKSTFTGEIKRNNRCREREVLFRASFRLRDDHSHSSNHDEVCFFFFLEFRMFIKQKMQREEKLRFYSPAVLLPTPRASRPSSKWDGLDGEQHLHDLLILPPSDSPISSVRFAVLLPFV